MSEWLYHGTPARHAARVLREGVEGPSYWGTLEDARTYAGTDGLVVRVDPERDPGTVAFGVNEGVLRCMLDAGDLAAENAPTDWRESLAVLGSVRCSDRVPAHWLEIVPASALAKRRRSP